jgi:pyruvate formate lyase activating enzyme
MIFRGWQKTSLIEYPGKVSTVLFSGGCNFRCPFCYNRELVLDPGKLPKITEDEVFALLSKRKGLYQAVMVTGGEPTMDATLPEFFRKVKSHGLLTGLETNGTNPEMLKLLAKEKLLDYIAMDVKAPLSPEKYAKACGVDDGKILENVRESIKIIMKSGIDYEFRTTIVPSLHTRDDILQIGKDLSGAKKYVLQQFSAEKDVIDLKGAGKGSYPDSFLREMCKEIKENFASCETRNLNS